MFFYLIAFTVALISIFGLYSVRNSLRDFSNTGFNKLEQLLYTSRIVLPHDEPEDQVLEIGGGEELLMKTDEMHSEGATEIMEDILKSVEEKPASQKHSSESFTFDYKARYDFSRDAVDRTATSEKNSKDVLVPQDMWNILKKTAVPVCERKNAESLFEALLQETLRESRRLQDDDVENEIFNKTQIIGEATFEKMLEEQNLKEAKDIKDQRIE